jgi:hypothetical protein
MTAGLDEVRGSGPQYLCCVRAQRLITGLSDPRLDRFVITPSVQRSSVSVVTRTLQMAGLIQQSRGSITVTDRPGLEEVACECYSKIRRIYERLLPGTYSQTHFR